MGFNVMETDAEAVLDVEVALVAFDGTEVVGERLADERQRHVQAKQALLVKHENQITVFLQESTTINRI